MGYKLETKLVIDGTIEGDLDLLGTGITNIPKKLKGKVIR